MFAWGDGLGLTVFPTTPHIVLMHCTARLLVAGVSSATIEQDAIAISTFYADVKRQLQLEMNNPFKHFEVRQFIKNIGKNLRIQSKATRPFPLWEFVAMMEHLDRNHPKQLHARVVLQVHALPGLRRVAARALRIKRKGGRRKSLDFHAESDVFIFEHPDPALRVKFGKIMAIRVDVDKCMAPGATRWTFIPDIMVCGLTPVTDVITWIVRHGLPDGPFLAVPLDKLATRFSLVQYTGVDRTAAKAWAVTFPLRTEGKICPHSLRKMIVQALYDWARLHGLCWDTPIGEFIGWYSVKNATRPHYAGLTRDEQLDMLHQLDPARLPRQIATVNTGPGVDLGGAWLHGDVTAEARQSGCIT